MAPSDNHDLDALARRLDRCLGRIDSELARLIADGAADPAAATDAVEDQAAELHTLVHGLTIAAAMTATADVGRIVGAAIDTVVPALGFPLVVRTRHGRELPPVACRPAELQHAVRRALALCADHAGAGGELAITTFATTSGGVAIEVTADAATESTGAHLRERVLTLQAFVAGWQGRCRFDQPAPRQLRLCLELPTATVDRH